MACFATPYGPCYAAHCFNRADAQNNRPALIPAVASDAGASMAREGAHVGWCQLGNTRFSGAGRSTRSSGGTDIISDFKFYWATLMRQRSGSDLSLSADWLGATSFANPAVSPEAFQAFDLVEARI